MNESLHIVVFDITGKGHFSNIAYPTILSSCMHNSTTVFKLLPNIQFWQTDNISWKSLLDCRILYLISVFL